MSGTGVIIEPKSTAGKRKVPIPAGLRELLIERKLACGRSGGYTFGSRHDQTTWTRANAEEMARAEEEGREPDLLQPIGLHEARHNLALLMIDAGVNAKALSTYLGHSSIAITFDRYAHLMPGNEAAAAALLDACLMERASTAARLAWVEGTSGCVRPGRRR